MRCRLGALGVAGWLAGCVAGPPACPPVAEGAVTAELLFGMSIPGGGTVSAADFEAFAAAEIAPRFGGFTVLPGRGYWQGKAEGARLVLIVAPDTAETAARLAVIRARYKARFSQHLVGLITVQSCASGV